MNAVDRLRPEPQHLDPDWSETTLQHILAAGSTSGSAPTPRRAVARRRVLVGAAAAAAAVTSVVGSATIATSPASAAFAVERAGDGDLVVTIRRLADAPGLERALQERGVDAEVTYLDTSVPSDLDDGSGPSSCDGPQDPGAFTVDPEDAVTQITFTRAYLDSHRGARLDLTAAGGESSDDWVGVKVEWSDGRC